MSELAATQETDASLIKRSWLPFLESKGGEIAEGQRIAFPQFQQEIPDEYIIPCIQESVVRFEGKDVESFLQSQFTCDIKDLKKSRFVFGGYCTPKGRVLATFRLCALNGAIYMVCHNSIVTSLLDRLKMFVMRADVTFNTRSNLVVMCFNTNAGPARIPSSSQTGPAWPKECYDNTNPTQSEQLMVAPVSDAIEFINKSVEHTVLLDSDYWNLLQIRHGIPSITAATSNLFTPQNLNLDLISAVSFTKGCYPGQEIVARLRYLGRIKKRLVRGKLIDRNEVQLGEPVSLLDSRDNKAGIIVNATNLEGVTLECLMSVTGFLDSSSIYCYGMPPRKKIKTLPLPYDLVTSIEVTNV